MEWVKPVITLMGYAAAFIWGHSAGESKAYMECIERMQVVEHCLLDIINDLYQRLAKRREEN